MLATPSLRECPRAALFQFCSGPNPRMAMEADFSRGPFRPIPFHRPPASQFNGAATTLGRASQEGVLAEQRAPSSSTALIFTSLVSPSFCRTSTAFNVIAAVITPQLCRATASRRRRILACSGCSWSRLGWQLADPSRVVARARASVVVQQSSKESGFCCFAVVRARGAVVSRVPEASVRRCLAQQGPAVHRIVSWSQIPHR